MEQYVFNPQCITYSQMNLIFNSRIYYRRLTAWTRAYILSRYFGIGTAEDQFERFYLESLEIGDMLQIIFGRQYSEEYSQLLCQYAIAFRELITAQLEGNTEAINMNVQRLYDNVAERAAYLEALNPYWSEAQYIELFNTYIQLTFEVMNTIIAGDYSRNIEMYDSLTEHTNRMGDVFAEGLYFYITSGLNSAVNEPRDSRLCITYEQMNEIYNIRMFWFELVTWMRSYMLSRYVGIGNEDEVYARLKQVPVDYTNALRQIFGEEVASNSLRVLDTYIELIRAFVTAQLEGNIDELNRITQLLYENADERAAIISSANPYWDENEWRNRLINNLQFTIEQSTSFLRGDYARNIDIFTRLIDLAESTSNYFAQGLFNYISSQ